MPSHHKWRSIRYIIGRSTILPLKFFRQINCFVRISSSKKKAETKNPACSMRLVCEEYKAINKYAVHRTFTLADHHRWMAKKQKYNHQNRYVRPMIALLSPKETFLLIYFFYFVSFDLDERRTPFCWRKTLAHDFLAGGMNTIFGR